MPKDLKANTEVSEKLKDLGLQIANHEQFVDAFSALSQVVTNKVNYARNFATVGVYLLVFLLAGSAVYIYERYNSF